MVEIGKHKIMVFVSPALKINELIVAHIYDDMQLHFHSHIAIYHLFWYIVQR